jgi:hypothetical protein
LAFEQQELGRRPDGPARAVAWGSSSAGSTPLLRPRATTATAGIATAGIAAGIATTIIATAATASDIATAGTGTTS